MQLFGEVSQTPVSLGVSQRKRKVRFAVFYYLTVPVQSGEALASFRCSVSEVESGAVYNKLFINLPGILRIDNELLDRYMSRGLQPTWLNGMNR